MTAAGDEPATNAPASFVPSALTTRSIAVIACLAATALHAYPLARPLLLVDDFQILVKSWPWASTRDSLWIPANEHTMPLGRLSTWVLVQLAGAPTSLPLACRLHGVLAMVAGMILVFGFVRRELGHPFYGLLAMVLFGVTTVYEQAVTWFAAS